MSDITNIPTTGSDIIASMLFATVVIGAKQIMDQATEMDRLIHDGVIQPDPVTITELVAHLEDATRAMSFVWERIEAGDVHGLGVA